MARTTRFRTRIDSTTRISRTFFVATSSFLAAGCTRFTDERDGRSSRTFRHESIRAGSFQQFEALQGQNRTYWAGSFAAFELTESTVAYSRALVDRFFRHTVQVTEPSSSVPVPMSAREGPAEMPDTPALGVVLDVLSTHRGCRFVPSTP